MVGILLSFWEGPFSGAMLVLGRVSCAINSGGNTPQKFNSEFTPDKTWLEDDPISFFGMVNLCKCPGPFARLTWILLILLGGSSHLVSSQ